MTNTWKEQVGQQLQVANKHIVDTQNKLSNNGYSTDVQTCLQNALGGIAKAWEIINTSK